MWAVEELRVNRTGAHHFTRSGVRQLTGTAMLVAALCTQALARAVDGVELLTPMMQGVGEVQGDSGKPARDSAEFYRTEWAGLVVLAAVVLGRRLGAVDIAQVTTLDPHRRWEPRCSYDSPRAWFRKVVVQRSRRPIAAPRGS